MATVSAHAVAARLRRRIDPTAGRRGVLEQGVRIAALLFGGSALAALLLQLALAAVGPALADPLALPSATGWPPVTSTWAYVLFESCLLPHRLPGSAWAIWGAGPLALTVIVGGAAFAAGRDQALRPLDVLLLALPAAVAAALVAIADALVGGGWQAVLVAPLAGVVVAAMVGAGAGWRMTRYARGAAPYLRALMAATWAIPVAVVVAAPAVLLAPAGVEPGGVWMTVLLPFAPNAVLRGALNGVGMANSIGLVLMLLAATAVATVLNRRSMSERTAYAVALAVLLSALTATATPVGSATAAWQVFARALPAGLLVGIVATAVGPYLGVLRAGHALTRSGLLRELGDRMPPPAAAEIVDVSTVVLGPAPARPSRPRVAAAPQRPARPVRHHVGRIAVGVAATLAALLALTAAVAVIVGGAPGDGTPEIGVAQAYLEAAGSGDAARAWPLVTVDAAGLPASVRVRLLGRDDFARTLALAANHAGPPSGLRLDVTGRSGSAVLVHARFADAAGSHETVLHLVRVGSGYKVQLEPAGLTVPATPGARVTVDGAPVEASGAPLAVIPGTHHVAVEYPAPFVAASADVLAVDSYGEPVVAPVGARLDDSAIAAARTAVAAALRTCVASASPHPTGCPQAIDAPAGTVVKWTLIGDPAQSLVVLPDDRGGAVAHGQFETFAAYDVHVPEDVKHVAAGGSFRAPLSWSAGRWSVAGSVDVDSAELPRPPVSDADVLAAVRSGFARCATTPLLRPADCPQTEPSEFFVKDVAWSLAGDPVAGAVVTFDARHGLLNVTGTYAMNVRYVEGGDPKQAQSGGRYRADVLWDGRGLLLVAINRA